MKFKILLCFLAFFLIPLAVASISHTLDYPDNLFRTEQTSIEFNWTPTTTGSVTTIPSYLYVTEYGNESNFILNKSIRYCTNATSCNVTVEGFIPEFYRWRVVSGDAATQAVVTGTTAYPYNTSAGNNTLDISYSINGTAELCNVTLNNSEVLNASDVVMALNNACNLTVTNTTVVILTSQGYGSDEYITIDGGNASGILGLSGEDYGSQTNSTSDSRWFEIYTSGTAGNHTYFRWENDSGFEAMRLDKDTGDLNVAGGINASNMSLAEDLSISGNLTLGQKIIFAFGEMIDNIVNGWISVTGGLHVTEDANISKNLTVDVDVLHVDSVSDKVGIGTTEPSHELNVVGDANITRNLIVKNISMDYPFASNWSNTTIAQSQITEGFHANTSENIIAVVDLLGYYNASRINTTVLQNESGNLGVAFSFFDNLYLRMVDAPNSTGNWSEAHSSYYNSSEIDISIASVGNWTETYQNYYNSSEVDTSISSVGNWTEAYPNYYNSSEVDVSIASVGNWTETYTDYYNSTQVDEQAYYNETRINTTDLENQSGNLGTKYSFFESSFIELHDEFIGDINGPYNATVFNGTAFNDSVDERTASTTYLPANISTTAGTLDAGDITSIQSIDTDWYNVSEAVGANPLRVEINFSDVIDFGNILIRERYIGGLGHDIEVQLYDYDASAWDNYGFITDQSVISEANLFVLDASVHISGGLVQMRFEHIQNGNSGHDLFIDYIALQDGFTTLTTSNHDSLLGRDDTDNHPWALDRNGSKPLTANMNQGPYNFTNESSWWLGKINASNVQDEPWIETSQEPDLNVNSSDYWDNLTSYNGTVFEEVNGNLTIKYSWWESFVTGLIAVISWSGGDLSGTGTAPSVNDESHRHAAENTTSGTFGDGDYKFPGNISATNISTNMTWTDNYGYPVACPVGSAITQLGDSVICTVLSGAGNSTAWNRTVTDVVLANPTDLVHINALNMTDNITMTSSNGTTWKCSVNNSGSFNCIE